MSGTRIVSAVSAAPRHRVAAQPLQRARSLVAACTASRSAGAHTRALSSSSSSGSSQPPVSIAIPYYSLYGHIRTMAEAQAKGVEEAGGRAVLLRISETMPPELREKVGGAEEDTSHPEATPDDLVAADGFLWGLPSRFGCAPAQAKALLDATGGVWAAGKLIGKPAGVFTSSNTQNGGVATIALTFLPNLAHHGIVFVPHGYRNNLSTTDELHGCSPWGAGTIAGSCGERQPSEMELEVATSQGRALTEIAIRLARK